MAAGIVSLDVTVSNSFPTYIGQRFFAVDKLVQHRPGEPVARHLIDAC